MASYYGYKATIDLLMMHSNIESNQKLKRVKFLENLITSNQILNVPEKYDIINSIKYVEIGDKNEEIS